MTNSELGEFGEAMAMQYLYKEGYQILARNYRCRLGEVDLIVKQGDVLVFVEVKTRSDLLLGTPAEAVDRRKLEHIRRVAIQYVSRHGLEDMDMRVDVVEIVVRHTPGIEF